MASEPWCKAVAAAIVPHVNRVATIDELRQWLRERLRFSRVSEVIVFREQLPCKKMRKVLRRVIRLQLQR